MSSPRKALLIRMAPYDLTQAVPRAAATLEEMGYEITILSLDTTLEKPEAEYVGPWRVLWFRHTYKPRDKASFLWTWLCWWRWVLRQIRRHRYDIVQASNLESVVPCVIARTFRRFALVLDVRDPWGMNSADAGSLLMRMFKAVERWAAARVDGIVLSQGILDRTGAYFGPKVCRRVPCVQVLNVPGRDLGEAYRPPDTRGIRLNFSGHITYARNAQAIFDLAKEVPGVCVDVVGETRDQRLLDAIQATPNIRMFGRVSFEDTMALLQQANLVAVMYDTNTEVAVVSSANKMFEAMMMSRPYVASCNGFPGVIAEQYGLGWAIPYGDTAALVALAKSLLASPEKIESAARNSRTAYETRFTWKRQKANLVLLYRTVLGDERPPYRTFAGWDRLMGTVSSPEDGVHCVDGVR